MMTSSGSIKKFPYEIKLVDEETKRKIGNDFSGEKETFCMIGPKKWFLPFAYREHAEHYYNFKVRKDDVWLVSYQRSGSTWTKELLWLINNGLNYEKAKEIALEVRFKYFEFNIRQTEQEQNKLLEINKDDQETVELIKFNNTPGYVFAEAMESPRHLKSHLPFSLLPPDLLDICKVVYVVRNPRDIIPSFYHYTKLFRRHNFIGDFRQFWEYFKNDQLLYSPYWEHVNEAWEKRNHPNLLILFYEDLVQDMPKCIKKLTNFYGKPEMTEEQINKLCEHLKFDNFKSNVPVFKGEIKGWTNKNAPDFIRRGKVGGNPEYTPELLAEVNKWIDENQKKYNIELPIFC